MHYSHFLSLRVSLLGFLGFSPGHFLLRKDRWKNRDPHVSISRTVKTPMKFREIKPKHTGFYPLLMLTVHKHAFNSALVSVPVF